MKRYLLEKEVSKEQFIIFCPETSYSKADKLLTGLSALKYATEFRDSGKKVIFCMKDIFDYALEVNALFNAMKIASPSTNLFYELASQSYRI